VKTWALALFALLAAAGGALVYQVNFESPEKAASATAAAERLYAARLPDMAGGQQPVAQWRGRVLVVNFWATWCEPCREEIPVFVQMQSRYRDEGVVFVGIAVDQVEKVAAYAKDMRINYPLLIGGLDAMELARHLGNTKSVLPFTVVLDKAGAIAVREVGVMKADRLEGALKQLI
jgi:thiol-disulfide isomerase/thioredoxin